MTTERLLKRLSYFTPVYVLFRTPNVSREKVARVKRPQHGLWNALCFQMPTQQGELKRCLGPVLQKKTKKKDA